MLLWNGTNMTDQIPNPSVAALYEDALVYEVGSAIASSGALTAFSGAKTGRSPSDKRIVKESSSENEIWYVFLHAQLSGEHTSFSNSTNMVTQVGTCQQAYGP